MKNYYWKVLLTEWRRKGHDGLTIPFLIGAQNYFTGIENRQDVKDLIVDIAKYIDFEVYLTYCMNIKELILGIRTGSKLKIAGSYVKLDGGNNSNFFLTKFVEDLGSNLDEITNNLIERYQSLIDDKLYSINQTIWGSYTDEELNFIQDCANKQ